MIAPEGEPNKGIQRTHKKTTRAADATAFGLQAMILDATSAGRFIEGYKSLLLEIDGARGKRREDALLRRLVAARSEMVGEPQVIDDAVSALHSRGHTLDADVLEAVRGIDVRQWVYLRDTSRHSIFIDPSGDRAYGVVGLTDRISMLVEGTGVFVEAGIVFYRGQFVCDGLVSRSVWLGANYRREFNEVLRTIKAKGQFCIGRPNKPAAGDGGQPPISPGARRA